MPRSLFRQEAIDAQRQKFLGEASIARPMRMWVYTVTACTIAALAIAVAIWGQYTRRERVQGYLSSVAGAADVRMPDAGTITELMVREGDVVVRGDPLFRMTFDRSGVDDGGGDRRVAAELTTQVALLRHDREQAVLLGRQQVDQLKKRIADLETELHEIDVEATLQSQQLVQARRLLDKWLELKAQDFASEFYIIQYEKQVKDQEIKVQQLQRQRASGAKDLGAARADLPSTQLRADNQVAQIDRNLSQTSQAIAEKQVSIERGVKRDMIVSAPIDGTVTNIGPAAGQTVASETRFATVLPRGSALHAELLVPTRAIGFVKPGQPVTMRYEAFPYERFGQYGGKVENVGRDVWSRGESVGPLAVREPVYRIVVDLDRQDVPAGDQRFPLRAGMVVSADLLMERRSLLEWLFQPVLQLRQRIGGASGAAS